MKEFQRRKELNKKLYSPFSLIFLFIIAVLLIISTFNVYTKSRNARLKSEKTKVEMEELEKRTAELKAEIERIGSESGLEEELREKFNVKKPGEEVLVIMDKKQEDGRINNDEESGFFGKILEFVKNIF